MHPIISNIINLFEATTHDLDELTARRQKKKKKRRLENSTWPIITAQSTGLLQCAAILWKSANHTVRLFCCMQSFRQSQTLPVNLMQSLVMFTRRKGEISVGNESYLSDRKGTQFNREKKIFFFFYFSALSTQAAGISFLSIEAYSPYINSITAKLNLSPYHLLLNC